VRRLEDLALDQFTGTTRYYRHWLGYKITDGVKYLADKAGAYWLLDAIGSHARVHERRVPFQFWELVVKDTIGDLTMRADSDQPLLVQQHISFTDFPTGHLKLYYTDNVLLLPSEY
jgi:hypothetical protein